MPDDLVNVPEGYEERMAELRAKTLQDVGWSSIGELHEAYVLEAKDAERLREAVTLLRNALGDAAEDLEEVIPYAGDYFREKWGFDEYPARIRRLLDTPEARRE